MKSVLNQYKGEKWVNTLFDIRNECKCWVKVWDFLVNKRFFNVSDIIEHINKKNKWR